MRQVAIILAVAGMLALSGCAGILGGEQTGTVSLYLSDQPAAIDQFETLNVTVTEVAYRPADASNDSENATEDDDLVVRDVTDTRVDLTELKGANATLIGNTSVPAGNYTGVFVSVTNASGTLASSGETVDVKVPSETLHINSQFTVGSGETVDFVFDMTVVQRGTQGYLLQPVVSESGAGVPIDRVPA